MDVSHELSAVVRKTLLAVYRSAADTRTSRRAHLLSWPRRTRGSRAHQLLFCSAGFISGVVKDFRDGGITACLPESNGESVALPVWATQVIEWFCEHARLDFRYFPSCWSCGTLAEVLAWESGHRVCAETVRDVLQSAGYDGRLPRPVVGPEDSDYAEKLLPIQLLLEKQPLR